MENRFWFGDTPQEGIITFHLDAFSEKKLTPTADYKSMYWGFGIAAFIIMVMFLSLFQNVKPIQTQAYTFTNALLKNDFEYSHAMLSPALKEQVNVEQLNQTLEGLGLSQNVDRFEILTTRTNGDQVMLQGTLFHKDSTEQPFSLTLSKYAQTWLIDEVLFGQDPFAESNAPELFFRSE